jgi:hypothetical protein
VDLTAYGTTWASQARGLAGAIVDIADATDAATRQIVLSLTHVQTTALVRNSYQ